MNRAITIFMIILISGLLVSCGQQEATGEQTAAETKQIIVPVEAQLVKIRKIEQRVPVVGVLEPVNQVDILAEVSGEVTNIYKRLGDRVSTSDTLARIDDEVARSNFEQARAQVLSARNNVEIAKLNLSSDQNLFESGDISKLALENSTLALKSAQANYKSALANLSLLQKNFLDTRVTSPVAGLISRFYVDKGTMVSPGTPLYRVVNISTLKARVGIPQEVISRVVEGTRVNIRVTALNGTIYQGIVRHISPQADENSGAFTVEIHVQNTPGLKIKAGMSARFELVLNEFGEKLTIPDHALIIKNDNNFVYKIMNKKAELTPVVISETIGRNLVLESGLAENDTIVVVGMKNLGVNTRVQIETVHQ